MRVRESISTCRNRIKTEKEGKDEEGEGEGGVREIREEARETRRDEGMYGREGGRIFC